ncbi:hypothetical protein CA54_02730 [Symmachiella macrocystis]|uniref:Zinc-finger domain-containing protein n=1 Tax=Symmachiella macrocystis TaxID=2527985 RepID=A0A5C6BJE9_9PLAN|nr:zf-HC2 domain-containing protein [Symmachiella macrocystis]TWU11466.1 hypothetical protein CA54_02730 [Symmachiella macrocystis]
MNDKISEELLSAYLDGELSQSERADVAQLLESSPAAQQQLADFQKLSQWMQELPPAQPPQGFAQEVLLQAERRSLLREPTPPAPVTTTRRSWLKPTLGIAAAAAAVVFLVRAVPAPQPVQQPMTEAIVVEDMDNHQMEAETAPAEALTTDAQSDLKTVSRNAATVALPAINSGQTADAEKFIATDEADTMLRQSKQPAIKKDKLVRLPAGQKWNRSRIGEVIHMTELDESQEQVAVFKAVVVNIDQWIGGTQVDVIGLEGAPDTIAIHLEGSPEELADLVANINDDGGQLLDLEAGQPILVAQLSTKEQAHFGASGGEQTDDRADDALSVPPQFGSRTSPQSHIPKDVPPPALGSKKRSITRKNETAKESRGEGQSDGKQKPKASRLEGSQIVGRAIARQTTRAQVTAVPEALQSQIPAGTVDIEKTPSKPAVPSSSEELADKPAIKLAEQEAIGVDNAEIKKQNADAPRRVRMILLVRQQSPAAKKVPAPPAKKAGDGGGAA